MNSTYVFNHVFAWLRAIEEEDKFKISLEVYFLRRQYCLYRLWMFGRLGQRTKHNWRSCSSSGIRARSKAQRHCGLTLWLLCFKSQVSKSWRGRETGGVLPVNHTPCSRYFNRATWILHGIFLLQTSTTVYSWWLSSGRLLLRTERNKGRWQNDISCNTF